MKHKLQKVDTDQLQEQKKKEENQNLTQNPLILQNTSLRYDWIHHQWCSLVYWGFWIFSTSYSLTKVTQLRLITSQPASIQHSCSSAFYASLSTVFVARPTKRTSVTQGLFKGGSGLRAIAQTHPAFPKMPRASVSIPLKRSTSDARW